MGALSTDQRHMQQALRLAALGQGHVEPNPMVGCVVAVGDQVVGEGWHQEFGGPHAEVMALEQAGDRAQGATLYVTLEPCCHHGKTPPCTEAVISAQVKRVVIAQSDPFALVAGQGIERLREAGIDVVVGTGGESARRLNAPYLKRIEKQRPWIIAKWAMTLDGKIASCSGDSQWISSESSRRIVHQIRGRVDAVMVGSATARRDDPLLTSRPGGPRTAARIVIDSQATLPADSQLAVTAAYAPVIVAVAASADDARCDALSEQGCQIVRCPGNDHLERLAWFVRYLGQQSMTNVLVEGGGGLLGNLLQLGEIDECHVFVAPKLIGGTEAVSPMGGSGIARIAEAMRLIDLQVERLGDDTYIRGRTLPAIPSDAEDQDA